MNKIVNESYYMRYPEMFERIARMIDDGFKTWNILTLPCCRGEETYSILHLIKAKHRVRMFGADISFPMLQIANSRICYTDRIDYRATHLWLFKPKDKIPYTSNWTQLNCQHLPYKTESFDIIVCNNLGIYVDAKQLCPELFRVLKNDGTLFANIISVTTDWNKYFEKIDDLSLKKNVHFQPTTTTSTKIELIEYTEIKPVKYTHVDLPILKTQPIIVRPIEKIHTSMKEFLLDVLNGKKCKFKGKLTELDLAELKRFNQTKNGTIFTIEN